MSDMSGFGLPKSRPMPKPGKLPNTYQSQRIRFGILAARHMLERWRLTPAQVDDLEGCLASGWKYRDSQKAFDHEIHAATLRQIRRG